MIFVLNSSALTTSYSILKTMLYKTPKMILYKSTPFILINMEQIPLETDQNAQSLFTKQQDTLTKAFEKLKKTTRNKMRKINEGQINGNDKDLMTKIKSKLNGEVEALHLAVSNYFGDCDKRKQKIEAEISEKVDFTDFGYIADTILSF